MVIFHEAVQQPIYNALISIYDILPWQDLGIAIIILTIIIKGIMYPLQKKQIENMKAMADLQPEMKQIQKDHKEDKEAQTKAMMALYKKHGTNPLSGCLPLIVQIIVFFGIYSVINMIIGSSFAVQPSELYSFVNNPGAINHLFLNFLDLAKPSIPLAVLTAAAQFYQTKQMIAAQPTPIPNEDGKPDFAQMMNKQMLFIGPIMILVVGFSLPAALPLYWVTSTVLMIAQQTITLNTKKSPEIVTLPS